MKCNFPLEKHPRFTQCTSTWNQWIVKLKLFTTSYFHALKLIPAGEMSLLCSIGKVWNWLLHESICDHCLQTWNAIVHYACTRGCPINARGWLNGCLCIFTSSRIYHIIIIVIITWPGEKPSQKKYSDITVFRVSDSFKWLMFMQMFEHGVTVFNHSEAITCVLLFSVYCFQLGSM